MAVGMVDAAGGGRRDEGAVASRAGTLGAAIHARRLELGLTQEDLARRIADDGDPAFRQSDVSRLEKGRVGLPRRDRLERIARALGLPPGELLVRSGWAGAVAALPEPAPEPGPEPAVDVASAPATIASPVPLAATPDAAPQRPVVPDPRLQDLLARAQETRARSQDLLRRLEEDWGPRGHVGGRIIPRMPAERRP